ncbi:hypothetical protein SDRG_10458 [Saprolegnia diclina VS20]|uniref:3'-5' exonuclease domain-containing protein n=1 Tax=Saprolegnia diclina (strain VS20) TaxID=1156394 RepID=T0RI11_SAPDV|nr:hypothetical protein SDRG_10458 [Saprolegnia diclina VS20]EQC31943.1 hypothetical protein SDRG_10458 [Saprolegnia diclina VS20]|eukprot:XP_008614671.1 hypothetical protein SDRG_10458 [Saprolegnia diclina VS20]
MATMLARRSVLGLTRTFSSRRGAKRAGRPSYGEDSDAFSMGSAMSLKAIDRVLDDEARRIRGEPSRDEGRQRRWAAAMEKKNARKQSLDYLQQPLFRSGSVAGKTFGGRSLLDYVSVASGLFPGPIHIIATPDDEAPFAAALASMRVVGIDCESRPQMFGRYDPPVAMVQVASHDLSLLYRIRYTSAQDGLTVIQPTFPALQALLADANIVKIGHGCKSDFQGIQKDGIAPVIRSTLDTLPVASGIGCLKPNLAALGLIWQSLRIDKAMQTSDWECSELSLAQIQYAATDAWMARQVMLSMLQISASHKLVHVVDYLPDGRVHRAKNSRETITQLCVLAQAEGINRAWEPALALSMPTNDDIYTM